MRQILIAGCGDVGSALGRSLAADGHVVWGLRRRTDRLPACIRPIAADLTEPDLHRHLPHCLTDIVYTAAASERSDRAYVDVYVKGLDNLLGAIEAHGQPIRRVIFTSSTAVYGQTDGRWVDEDASTAPAHFTGRRLLEAEQRLREAPWTATVVRLAGIYGPHRTRLLDRLCSGQARLPCAPWYTNRIHVDDCVGALGHLMDLESPDPVYIGVDHDPADLRQVMQWLAGELGVQLLCGERADHDSLGRRDGANKRCCNDRLVGSGYVFLYPSYRDGYGAIIRAHRDQHGSSAIR